jgi:hypothetical protein
MHPGRLTRPTRKFARLNTIAQPFEFEVDPEGNTQTRGLEHRRRRQYLAARCLGGLSLLYADSCSVTVIDKRLQPQPRPLLIC